MDSVHQKSSALGTCGESLEGSGTFKRPYGKSLGNWVHASEESIIACPVSLSPHS